jgi:hypothetical protein
MKMPNWLDSLLYSHIRAYRRHKFRRSRVRAELMAPIPATRPPIARLDDWLDRPAILTRGRDWTSEPERMWPIMNQYQRAQLQEKIEDEAILASMYRQPDAWPEGIPPVELRANMCVPCRFGTHEQPWIMCGGCNCACHGTGWPGKGA